jgi:hypothetical protein
MFMVLEKKSIKNIGAAQGHLSLMHGSSHTMLHPLRKTLLLLKKLTVFAEEGVHLQESLNRFAELLKIELEA